MLSLFAVIFCRYSAFDIFDADDADYADGAARLADDYAMIC